MLNSIVNKEFLSFKHYIASSGLQNEKVQEMLMLAQTFLRDVTSPELTAQNLNTIYQGKCNDVFCALAWLMMHQSFKQNKPLHKGMFILNLNDKKANQRCYDFFKENATKRPSSHFNRKYHKKQGSFGITLNTAKHRLPGPVKKEKGLEQLTTGLFMMLDEPHSRIAFKYEDFPFDILHHPIGSLKHMINWLSGKKINTPEVIGRREDALPLQIASGLEKYINSKNSQQITQNQTQLISLLNSTLQNIKKSHQGSTAIDFITKLKNDITFYKDIYNKKLALKSVLLTIVQSSNNEADMQEAKAKALHRAFGYIDDILSWTSLDHSKEANELRQCIFEYGYTESAPQYGNEVHITFKGMTDPELQQFSVQDHDTRKELLISYKSKERYIPLPLQQNNSKRTLICRV